MNARRLAALPPALLLAAALAAPPAAAREWRMGVQVGASAPGDDGYAVVADEPIVVHGGGSLQVGLLDHLLVGVQALRAAPGEAELHGLYGTGLGTLDVGLTARYLLGEIPWLRPFVEVGAGASRADLELGEARLDAKRWGAHVAGLAGVEARLPPGLLGKRGTFSLGVELAGGYLWRSRFDFDDVGGVDLGSVGLSGLTWHLGFAAMWGGP